MNVHDIELPPLPTIDVMGKTSPQIWFTAAEVDALRRAAIEAYRKQRFENGEALKRYKEYEADEEQDPIERLRFFCSLAMSGQDWLDSEQFFEDLIADRKRRGEPVAWSGWGCQYPGKIPRLYGDRSIAEVNCDHENGDQLLFLTAALQPAEHNIDYKQLYEQMCNRCDSLDAKLAEYERRGEPVKELSDDAILNVAIESEVAYRDSAGDVLCFWREDTNISKYLIQNARALLASTRIADYDRMRVALTTIKEWPISSPLNMDARNMQVVARVALSQEQGEKHDSQD